VKRSHLKESHNSHIYDSQHPGFVFTPMNAEHGYTRDSLPFDDESLPGNFYVWAATKKAAFLTGDLCGQTGMWMN